jgi:nitroreductase/FMN reductase [NAD(P)H]
MSDIFDTFKHRFGAGAPAGSGDIEPPQAWDRMASRGVVRRFKPEPLAPETIDTLCAIALSSPTKSDLQKRDILIVEDPRKRARICELLPDNDWIPNAPHFLLFLGNNRRQRQIHAWRGKPFANDHLDAFFNATVDAAIALSAFVTAAEAAGLGCTPVSVIRDHAEEVSRMCELPDHVFPIAGLGLGRPERPNWVTLRLPLTHTVHRDTFKEKGLREAVEAYDKRRRGVAPYRAQRDVDKWGEDEAYGWSEDKARQYAVPQRTEWGEFVRAKGFKLE